MKNIREIDILKMREGSIFHYKRDGIEFSMVIIQYPGTTHVYGNYIIGHILNYSGDFAKKAFSKDGQTEYKAFKFCRKDDFKGYEKRLTDTFFSTPCEKCVFIKKDELDETCSVYQSETEEEKLIDEMSSFYLKTV